MGEGGGRDTSEWVREGGGTVVSEGGRVVLTSHGGLEQGDLPSGRVRGAGQEPLQQRQVLLRGGEESCSHCVVLRDCVQTLGCVCV